MTRINLAETLESLTMPARLAAAADTLDHYGESRGLADLLCDLMHYVRAAGTGSGRSQRLWSGRQCILSLRGTAMTTEKTTVKSKEPTF